MSSKNIGFHGEIRKYSSDTPSYLELCSLISLGCYRADWWLLPFTVHRTNFLVPNKLLIEWQIVHILYSTVSCISLHRLLMPVCSKFGVNMIFLQELCLLIRSNGQAAFNEYIRVFVENEEKYVNWYPSYLQLWSHQTNVV